MAASSTVASTSTTTANSTPSTSTSTTPFSSKHRGKKRGLNLYRLSKKLTDDDSSIEYCQELGLLGKSAQCPTCKTTLQKLYHIKRAGRTRQEHQFQCGKRKCRDKKNQVSIRKGTWFGGTNLSFRKSLILTYCFIHKLPYKTTIHETSVSSAEPSTSQTSDEQEKRLLTTSRETIADYYNYCREVCTWSVENKLATNEPIGGPGKIVEIDESKFGKRKYQRGRIVEGQWVFGGICREDKKIFLVPVPDNKRDRATLEPIILKHIVQGSTIISDCWRAYDSLGAKGFHHLTVNHSYNFVDPTSGAHTNNIESLWWQIKRQLADTHTRGTEENWYKHLSEYMWRHGHKESELFEAFIKDAADLYPPKQ